MAEKFTIEFIDKKSPEWYLTTLKDKNGLYIEDVSINAKDKNGVLFPRFNDLMTGFEVEGEFWRNPSGKAYLFPPKEQKKGNNIAKAQERKEATINKTMDRKEENIKTAAIMRDTTLLATAEFNAYPDADLKLLWKKWHEFLEEQWNGQ